MRISKTLFSLLSLLGVFATATAQQYKDCDTALELCGQSPFIFPSIPGIGQVDSDVANTCLIEEFTSTWIEWTAQESGNITFTITPDRDNQDLDFIVFKLDETGDCANKEVIRCMASGMSGGRPSLNCIGSTGLAIGETDSLETAGCDSLDNNFLAPIQAEAGDKYILLINNFSSTDGDFSLSFSGSATLECITSATSENEPAPLETIRISPTVSSGFLSMQLSSERLLGCDLSIYNMIGQPVFTQTQTHQLNSTIELPNVPNGAYMVVATKGKMSATERFFISR